MNNYTKKCENLTKFYIRGSILNDIRTATILIKWRANL